MVPLHKSFRHWRTVGAVRGGCPFHLHSHSERLMLRLSLSLCTFARCSGKSTRMRVGPLLREFWFVVANVACDRAAFYTRLFGCFFCSVQRVGTRLVLWNCNKSPLCAERANFLDAYVRNGRSQLHIGHGLISELNTCRRNGFTRLETYPK